MKKTFLFTFLLLSQATFAQYRNSISANPQRIFTIPLFSDENNYNGLGSKFLISYDKKVKRNQDIRLQTNFFYHRYGTFITSLSKEEYKIEKDSVVYYKNTNYRVSNTGISLGLSGFTPENDVMLYGGANATFFAMKIKERYEEVFGAPQIPPDDFGRNLFDDRRLQTGKIDTKIKIGWNVHIGVIVPIFQRYEIRIPFEVYVFHINSHRIIRPNLLILTTYRF